MMDGIGRSIPAKAREVVMRAKRCLVLETTEFVLRGEDEERGCLARSSKRPLCF